MRAIILFITFALVPLSATAQSSPQTGSFTTSNGWLRHPERPLTLSYDGRQCVLDGVLFRGDYDKAAEKTDGATSRTRLFKLDSFTIKQSLGEYRHVAVADMPIPAKGLGDFPKVNFYIPEADAGAFILAHRETALHAVKFDRFTFACGPTTR